MVAVLKGLLAGATLSPMEDKLIGAIVGMLGVKLNSQTLSPLGFLKMISGDVEMPEKAFKLLQLAHTYSQEAFARPIITGVLDGWLGETSPINMVCRNCGTVHSFTAAVLPGWSQCTKPT
jgi:hypothetical protein